MDGSSFSSDLSKATPILVAQPKDDGIAMLARHYDVERALLERLDADPERKKCRSLSNIDAANDLHDRLITIAGQLRCDARDVLHLFVMRPGLSRRNTETTTEAVLGTVAILQRHGVGSTAAKNALLKGNGAIVMQMSPAKLESRVSDLAAWHDEGLFHDSVTRQDAIINSLRRAVVGDDLWAVYKRIGELRPIATGQKPMALFGEKRREAAATLARYENIVAEQKDMMPTFSRKRPQPNTTANTAANADMAAVA